MVALNPMKCVNPACDKILDDSDDIDWEHWPRCKACGLAIKQKSEQQSQG